MDKLPYDISKQDGFFRAIESNSGIITKICYYYASDAEDFDDLHQDVLANMWAYRDSYRGEASITTWIYRVALNTCISAFRKRKRKAEKVDVSQMPDLADPSAELSAMQNEMHRLIGQLNKEEKAVILMWLDGLSYDEISSVIGCTRNTIATRLKRIKDKIVRMSDQ